MYINNTHSTLSLALLAVSPYALSVKAEAKVQPNVIFVLVDDLGSAELGCFGNTFNETPNIDKLAQQGIRFPNTYTAQTVSSPTRAALMTGLYPARTGISDYLRPDDSKHLSEEYTTMPEMFKSNGYNTCIVGKYRYSNRDK